MTRSIFAIDLARSALLALAIMVAGATGALAHPHAWIDLRSTVILDEEGKAVAIEQEWLFDEFYTVFVRDEFGLDGADQQETLRALAEANLENLRPYDYFTEVRADGAKVPVGTVSEYETELRNGRLWMRFVTPLETPVDAAAGLLTYAVYDPTYYIEIVHLEDDVIGFRGASAGNCTGRIIPPSPSAETTLSAQALDRDATPNETLGRLFAETVEVSCR